MYTYTDAHTHTSLHTCCPHVTRWYLQRPFAVTFGSCLCHLRLLPTATIQWHGHCLALFVRSTHGLSEVFFWKAAYQSRVEQCPFRRRSARHHNPRLKRDIKLDRQRRYLLCTADPAPCNAQVLLLLSVNSSLASRGQDSLLLLEMLPMEGSLLWFRRVSAHVRANLRAER